MGLLDEAIREHLELKRRRGADPGEIQEAEREALGPVRRSPEPEAEEPFPEGFGGEYEAEDRPELPYDHQEEHWEEEPDFTYEPEAERPAGPPAEPPALEWEDHPERHDPEPPDSGGSDVDRGGGPAASEETAEYDVRREHAPDKEEGDVLDETPDFLHDAPDHDQLWFEQRPPRDFDFDG